MPTRGEMERDAALRDVPRVLRDIAEALGVQSAETQRVGGVVEAVQCVEGSIDNLVTALDLRNEIAKEQVRATMVHAALLLTTRAAEAGESIPVDTAIASVKGWMDEVVTRYE